MGFGEAKVTGSLNERFGNAGSVPIVTLPVARAGAMQVLLLGRASNPVIAGVGGVGAGGGMGSIGGPGVAGGAGGGTSRAPLPPLSQPAIRKAKDNNVAVVCLACGMGLPLVVQRCA